jgi:nicotinamide-nucleotide amidase
MDLELVTVGTELLLGFTIDTNAADIAQAVSEAGGRVVHRASVGDDGAAIRQAVGVALERTGFVVVTGGLGPTADDITKNAVAELLDVPLLLDESYLRQLEERFAEYRPGPLPPSNRSQAEMPRGAVVWPNRRGTAPGLVFESVAGTVVLLPGVPIEMRMMLEEQLVPMIRDRATASSRTPLVTRSLTLRTTGVTESGLVSLLGGVEEALDDVSLAFLPGFGGVDLRLTAWQVSDEQAASLLDRAADLLCPRLGVHCYGVEGMDLAAVVVDQLRAQGLTVAVAESCTGGLIGARLTAIPGASEVFEGGLTTYSNRAKTTMLGVPEMLLDDHGAVSEAVVLEMMEGARRRLGTGAGIAVTGVAGPTGGTREKPVGTVWLAVGGVDTRRAVCQRFPGGREEVRQRSTQAALDLLRRLLIAS